MSLVRHIPNTITSLNLLCGALGVILTLNGRQDTSFLLMLAASVFDFCDGLAARALNAYSDIGKELDSLGDMVSFGLLPALMVFSVLRELCGESIWCYIPLVLVLFSALRLAKFNVDIRQHDSFIGLATPTSAMICGSLCYVISKSPGSDTAAVCAHIWVLPALSLLLSFLLVSEIPMFAFKFGKGKHADRATVIKRSLFLAVVLLSTVIVAFLGTSWALVVFFSFTGYILINVISAVIKV